MTILFKEDFPGLKNFIENIEEYKKKFLLNGVIAFRNANLSQQDQGTISLEFADALGLWPNKKSGSPLIYIEPHKELSEKDIDSDEIMLPWHTDHPWYINPICLGVWNMHTLETKDDLSGRTYFYDLKKMYSRLDNKTKFYIKDSFLHSQYSNHLYCQSHFYTKEPTVRSVVSHPSTDPLIFLNGKSPSDDDKKYFYECMTEIKNLIENDKDNRIEHRWEKGDLVIVDMFIMAHAVTGGFKNGQRIFTGMWSYYKNLDELVNPNFGSREGLAIYPPIENSVEFKNLSEDYHNWNEIWRCDNE